MVNFLRFVLALVLIVVIGVAALWAVRLTGYGYLLALSNDPPAPVRPEIAFAPLVDDALKDPDNPAKVFRVDMARVEHEFPLSRADLAGLTPAHVLSLNQEEADQLYGRLTAGPVPDGAVSGRSVFRARGRHADPARGDPGRSQGADRGGEDRDARGRRPGALEGQDVLSRRDGAAELRRGFPARRGADRRSRRAGDGRRAARGRRCGTSCRRRTSICCFPRSCIAGRACSTGGARASSSITPTTICCRDIRSVRTGWPGGTVWRSETRSG